MIPRLLMFGASVAVVAVCSAILAPVTFGYEVVAGPPRVEQTAFRWGEAEGRTLEIYVSTGMCVGEARPRLLATVRELPSGRDLPKGAAVIRASVEFPETHEVRGEVLPGEPVPVCAGIALTLRKRVRLRRRVAGPVIFDGYPRRHRAQQFD
jgi:hypothetical protein